MNLITLIGEIDPIGSVVHFKAHEEMKLTIFLMLNHSYKMRHIEVSQRSECYTYQTDLYLYNSKGHKIIITSIFSRI